VNRLSRWLYHHIALPKRGSRIALFIDGDGVSPAHADRAITWAQQKGRVCVLRTYGNHNGRAADAWASLIRKHGIVARHLPNLTPGKNASDIALTIDVTEVLLAGNIDTFVLVVSDTDFVPLVLRIKEADREVIGIGQKTASNAFRSACSEFLELGKLGAPAGMKAPGGARWSLPPQAAESFVVDVMRSYSMYGNPVAISTLGQRLLAQDPSFDPKVFSRRTLTELLKELPSLEVVELDGVRHVRLSETVTGTG
jgi:hypothetical protein